MLYQSIRKNHNKPLEARQGQEKIVLQMHQKVNPTELIHTALLRRNSIVIAQFPI
jgi:hypothetical protein